MLKSHPATPKKVATLTTMSSLSSWPVQRGRKRRLCPPTPHLGSRQSRWFEKSVQQQARLHDEDGPWLLTPRFPLELLPPVIFLSPLDRVPPVLHFTYWSLYFQPFFSPTGALTSSPFSFHPLELLLPVIFHPLELSPLAGMKERELLSPVSPVTFMLLLCLLELSPLVGRKERELPQLFHQFTCCKQQVIGEDLLDELATGLTTTVRAGFVVDEGNVYTVLLKLVPNPINLPIFTSNQVRIEGSNCDILQCIVCLRQVGVASLLDDLSNWNCGARVS
jgi:hypothetical protein